MYFDLKAFIRYNFRAFFKAKDTPYRLTFKRVLFLVLFIPFFILIELINRVFFLLDEIFYPGYHQQAIEKPIFIIGNPRSGTTFLQRILFKDKDTFTSLTVWELAVAPSITQRKLIWGIGKLLRLIGTPVRRLVRSVNKGFKQSSVGPVHPVKIEEAEEDEHLLFHAFATETLFNLYPYLDEVFPYFTFDRDIPREKQDTLMHFYHNLLQRHLYAHGGDRILLSKNPSHSSKIAALMRTFPGAHFIKLVRNPFEAVPSMLDTMATGLDIFCDPKNKYAFNNELIALMKYYYFYPVQVFKDQPTRCRFFRYDDLVTQPDAVIRGLYGWLGLAMSPAFQAAVDAVAHAEKSYQSRHEYPLAAMGLTEERIFREFEEVFSFYEFQERDFELPERQWRWQRRKWVQNWKKQRARRRRSRKTGDLPG